MVTNSKLYNPRVILLFGCVIAIGSMEVFVETISLVGKLISCLNPKLSYILVICPDWLENGPEGSAVSDISQFVSPSKIISRPKDSREDHTSWSSSNFPILEDGGW